MSFASFLFITAQNNKENKSKEPLYYQNYDFENVITPVNADKFVQLLQQTKYDESEIAFLEDGLRNRSDIGYEGPRDRQSSADNIPFSVGDKVELWNKLMKEVKLKRIVGPFDKVPFSNFIQSPIGLVPKSGNENETRLIFHLSYDCKRDGHKSLNHHTPQDRCVVKYKDLDYTIGAYLKVCDRDSDQEEDLQSERPYREQLKVKWRDQFEQHKRKNRVVYASKADLKSAFRILGLSKSSWQWLVMKAQDPTTGEWKYFIDKCLPFGASISCALFQHFSDALCHLIEARNTTPGEVTNYLDDFLFLALSLVTCNE